TRLCAKRYIVGITALSCQGEDVARVHIFSETSGSVPLLIAKLFLTNDIRCRKQRKKTRERLPYVIKIGVLKMGIAIMFHGVICLIPTKWRSRSRPACKRLNVSRRRPPY